MSRKYFLVLFICLHQVCVFAQTDSLPGNDTLSKFDKFNKKAEKFFKVFPVPIITYSTEAGNVFGLAKFNLFQLSKKDTLSSPSKLSEVVTFSTKGRINASVSTELLFDKNNYMILSFVNYKKQPEYLFGIGNDVKKEDVEEVVTERFRFSVVGLRRVYKKLYLGLSFDINTYFNIETDSSSFLVVNDIPGINGGASVGLGLALALDNRDNRYNPSKGVFVLGSLQPHPSWLGSKYQFTTFSLDMRTYFNPWHKHVIALQATTRSTSTGTTPFYELSLLGGDTKMRGYYEGAFRDNVLLDAQLEYRMPVWKIFGAVGWIGTGRVAPEYSALSLDGFKVSYGGGVRIRVDSKNNTNLRIDFGFGPGGLKGTYLNFAEAF
jgi:outer membrane protein assembly factor BamA